MTMRDELSGLERHARAVLEESLAHVDARTRSRLNQARQAAVAVAARGAGRPAWLGLHLMPVTGAAAAAVLVALALFNFRPPSIQPRPEGVQPAFEVLDMLANDENMRMMEDEDDHFYEWAAAEGAQSDAPPLRETGAEASG